nr:MAG TPA: hypothetical protein [Caudoviricetes sp.]
MPYRLHTLIRKVLFFLTYTGTAASEPTNSISLHRL